MVHMGVDLHKRMSQIAVLTADGELTQHRLPNDLAHLEPFFARLPTPSPIAIEASGTWWRSWTYSNDSAIPDLVSVILSQPLTKLLLRCSRWSPKGRAWNTSLTDVPDGPAARGGTPILMAVGRHFTDYRWVCLRLLTARYARYVGAGR